MQRQDIQERRIAKKIHSKKTIWIVKQTVQPRILGKIGEELEMVERKTIRKKKNGNNHGRRNREREIRS